MNVWTRWPSNDRVRTPVGWSWPANLLVAQGPASWPRGRRAASEAEEILSDAVAWWDVERSGFRDGDRWLRNLGTAGGVLNLRLGSSLLANSNDPLFLPVDQLGYIYLTGVAGNSISCTAPATAATYAAYPVGGATATTGAVTGGAAFTFSTAGSWTRVDLLDAGAVVVASFDGDLLTSGAATGLTDSYAVAWTINRSTSGRKSVAMPSRANGGRACMLLGTDDYLVVVGRTQHQLVNFIKGKPISVLSVTRNFGGTDAEIISKNESNNASGGWFQGHYSSGGLYGRFNTATSQTPFDGASPATGGIAVFVTTYDPAAGLLTQNVGTTRVPYRGYQQLDAQYTTSGLTVGTVPNQARFANMEFRAAAVWRRPLTTREITVLANSNLWGT